MKDFLFVLLLIICIKNAFTDSTVRTLEGDISGLERTSRNGRKFLGFQGIPYAEPPVGSLRFRSPIAKKPWNGILRADKDGNECPQISDSVKGSEDCLYLNVFTSELNPKSLLPVMVYVFGGAFIKLNASDVNTGPEFLLDKDIVLVTFNYRLGILGFLSTGDEAAPGNFGLKDQRLALRWVQRNIRKFGGDPDNVTLFGESAGGESVHLHVFSPKSKNTFKRYIPQSGTAINPRAVATDPSYYDYANKVAEMFNCSNTDNKAMIECLRGVDFKQLVNTTAIFDDIAQATNTKWRPTIEPESNDAFLTDSPANLIRNNVMKDCPVMTGNVKDEGTTFSSTLNQNESLYEQAVKQPVSLIEGLLRYYDPVKGKNLTELAIKIKDFYLGSVISNDKDTVVHQYTLLATDLYFLYPQVQWINYLRNSSQEPVYYYLFDYRGAMSKAMSSNLGDDIVAHADELFYIFPIPPETISPQYHIKRTSNDYEIVDLLVDMWTSFATKSTPTTSQLQRHDLWQPYSSGTYLKIGNLSNPTSTIENKLYEDRMNFWYSNVPQYSL